MHPGIFIDELWDGRESATVFVAMSFAKQYESRYREIYEPAITCLRVGEQQVKPIRVDERKSGDSIITEIVRGIAESMVVIADISAMSVSGDNDVNRNGNVMYELGIAHAAKAPDKVLILKDDVKDVIFDLTSIPYEVLDFTDIARAKNIVSNLIKDRIEEGDKIYDFKLKSYAKSMSPGEFNQLKSLRACPQGGMLDLRQFVGERSVIPLPIQQGIAGLLKAGCVEARHTYDYDFPHYLLTERGAKLCRLLGLEEPKNPQT